MNSLKDLEQLLLKNRNLTTKAAIEDFFSEGGLLDSSSVIISSDLKKAASIIKKAVTDSWPIVIHGDYDVDGLSGTAILWETIYRGLKYEKCLPFIPNRFDHGYGLSIESVDACRKLVAGGKGRGLLIAVDCGITALEEVKYAHERGFEVLIIDHHQKNESIPAATILWTDKLCAAGIAYFLSQALVSGFSGLDLAALATISDIQPLLGLNRKLVKAGLPLLSRADRFGIKALKEVSGIMSKTVGVYEAGWLLSPRLNASGRLEDALNSLRLLCSLNEPQARELAKKLSQINSERQQKTQSMVEHATHALEGVTDQKVLIAADESYHEGIIGLVAGKLVQKYHRPAVVISCGPEVCKGSARSISGFNIIEALRSQAHLLEGVGGHPAAAGFTVKTEQLAAFITSFQAFVGGNLDPSLLAVTSKVEAEISPELINWELLEMLNRFEPFGHSNPEPTFLTEGLEISDVKTMGTAGKHLSLKAGHFRAVGFGLGELSSKIKAGDSVNLIFTVVKNEWNGNSSLELRIKDLQK